MATKLDKNTYPTGLRSSDFKCSGPIATADGEFHSAKLADLGCFKQDGQDTNKGYHGAVVQANGKWFTYFEWGRTGQHGTFQFTECSSESEAQEVFVKQMMSKNAKRGEWVTIAGRKTLRAKKGKDCYLVRPLATRSSSSFGLPDAANVVSDDVKVEVKSTPKTAKRLTPFEKGQRLSLESSLGVREVTQRHKDARKDA